MSYSLQPHGLYNPLNCPGQNTGVVAIPFSRGSSQSRKEPRSPTLQANSLPAEPPEKPFFGKTKQNNNKKKLPQRVSVLTISPQVTLTFFHSYQRFLSCQLQSQFLTLILFVSLIIFESWLQTLLKNISFSGCLRYSDLHTFLYPHQTLLISV